MSRTPVRRERDVSDSTLRQVAQLNKLSFPELQERWRSLFGGEPPAYHRRFLVKRLAYRIQELAYGGLPDATRAQMADILQDAGPSTRGMLADRTTEVLCPHLPTVFLPLTAAAQNPTIVRKMRTMGEVLDGSRPRACQAGAGRFAIRRTGRND